MCRGTLSEVREGLGALQRLGTGRVTLKKVRDRSGDPRGGHGRVVGPFWRSGTIRGTLLKVWEGLRDTRVGLGRVGSPTGRSRMG